VAARTLDNWFETQVLPHEKILMRYLRRMRGNAADLADLRQEVYVRMYERAASALPASPKAFLLSTARHLVIDRARRERIISIDFTHDFDCLNVLIDERTPERSLDARQELRRLSDGLDRLSPDCRAVLWLRRVEGLSQRQVAEQLRMQEGTVSSHLSRALRTLTNIVFGSGPASAVQGSYEHSDNGGDDNATGHG
jgi:RNA polymerase sigma-70 factor (ECF subfamily)